MTIVSPVASDEESRITDVIERLQRRFSAIDREAISRVVHEALREFDGAAVRDFVPILVEKHSRDVLVQELRWTQA